MSFTKFSTAFARALHESGLSYNAIDSTQITSASVFSAPSGWNTGSKLPLRERRKPTQNYYLRVVLRWLRRLVLDTREHALGATSCQHPNPTRIARYTFQTARFPTNLGNSFIIHFTLIPTCSPSISSDVSSDITYSPSCDALWIATDNGSDTISRISRYNQWNWQKRTCVASRLIP